MTIEELAEETGRAVSTLKNHFERTKQTLMKKGIIINKIDNNNYTIKYSQDAKKIINPKKLMNYKFGKLQPLFPTEKRDKSTGCIIWKCKCDCGNDNFEVPSYTLISGNTQSCGCLKNASQDLTNQKFGKLTALYQTEKRASDKHIIWKCKCDCGNYCDVRSQSLTSGHTQSCGCLNISHGELKICNILKKANINYIPEYKAFKFEDSKYYARFDFFVDNKYFIEFDGKQHFNFDNIGWNTEEKVKYTQEHDKIKNEYCFNNNIPLIRIPYTHLKDLCLEDLQLETTKWRVI